jgi:hypothetical protein
MLIHSVILGCSVMSKKSPDSSWLGLTSPCSDIKISGWFKKYAIFDARHTEGKMTAARFTIPTRQHGNDFSP